MTSTGFDLDLTCSAFVLVLVVLVPHPALAQQPLAAPTPFPLIPAAHDRVGSGKIAAVEGSAGADLQRFSLAELQITQPVLVVLVPGGSGDKLELQLFHRNWDAPARTKAARGGPAMLRLRTQGDLGIGVRSAGQAAAPYRLLVWAGPELDELALAPVIAPLRTGPKGLLTRLGFGALAKPRGLALTLVALVLLVVLSAVAVVLALRLARAPSGTGHD